MGIFKCFYSASHSLSLSTLREMSMWLLVLRPLSLKIAFESHLWNMHISHTKMNCFFGSTKVLIMPHEHGAHQMKQLCLQPLLWLKVYPLSSFTLI